MTRPVIFEHEQGRHTWRVEATEWNGEQRLNVWPWYQPKDGGELRPCSPTYPTGGGFNVPLERVRELIAVLATIANDNPPIK